MTSRPSESARSQSHLTQRPSLLSARRLALMASVGLGVAVYGFSPAPSAFDIFGAAAHAQASQAVSNAAQPAGFADMVERVKPSVISVKVTMKKATEASEKSDDEGSGSPMERFFRQFGGPMACRKGPVMMAGTGE